MKLTGFLSKAVEWWRGPVSWMLPDHVRDHQHTLDPSYSGPIFVWDIDKTYLESNLDNFFSIVKLAMERAEDKRNVPGTATLLRKLRHGPGSGDANFPLFFLTGGPPQIGPVFEEKLRLDGLDCNGITFKSFIHYAAGFQLGRLREHVGYKVTALLENRLEFPPRAREVLFGDNSEQDPLIYSIYSDVVSRRIDEREMVKRLRENGALDREVERIIEIARELPLYDPVDWIYIHMALHVDPAPIEACHPRLVATYNSLQTACHLCTQGYLAADDVAAVARNLQEVYYFTKLEVARSVINLLRRKLITSADCDRLLDVLRAHGCLPEDLCRDDDRFLILGGTLEVADTLGCASRPAF